MSEHLHRAPAKCPVCAHELSTSRLSCAGCGTELVGQFERCRFCTLPPQQLELLTVFLASRGNLREVARHQGVSYPTARARLAGLLAALGLDEIGQEEPEPDGGAPMISGLVFARSVDLDDAPIGPAPVIRALLPARRPLRSMA